MKELSYLNQYLFKYKWQLLLGVIFIIISNLFAVYSPKIIQQSFNLIDEGLKARTTISEGETISLDLPSSINWIFDIFNISNDAFNPILNENSLIKQIGLLTFTLAVTYLLIAFFKGVFSFFTRQTIIIVSRRIEYDLKNEIFAQYQRLGQNFYKENRTGDLMNRISEDVTRVRMYLGPAIMYSFNLVTLVILAIWFMLKVNVTLTFYSLLPLPLLSIIIYYVSNQINKRSEKVQQQQSRISSDAQESFSGIRVIKSFNKEKSSEKEFEKSCELYRMRSMDLVKVNALFFPAMLILIGLSTIFTIYVGGLQEIKGEISVGNIPEFVIYINMLTWPFAATGWVTSLVQRAAASQKRINEFLKIDPEIENKSTKPIEIKGDIVFDKVSFTYKNSGIKALNNIGFHIKPGEKIGIIGRTGSGKSTIAAMLLRFYDPDSGKILIDRTPLDKINLEAYRSAVGYVSQDVILFSDTISNNIAFGNNEAGQQEVEKMASIAKVNEDINNFKHEFDTILGEKGVNLSGGQKQRISIARALLIKPKILIFDDAFSALDTQTENDLLNNLDNNFKNSTIIFISHRVSTIRNADRIFVINMGEIVEKGSNSELLAKGGLYAELFEQQLIEEGLDTATSN
jgi:ATP-binding cassette subfamily B protein